MFSIKRLLSYLGIAAIIVWLFGVTNTVRALEEMGVPQANYYSLAIGIAVQLVLTFGEHTVWAKVKDVRVKVIGYVILALDALTNLAGIHPLIVNLSKTSSYKQLALPQDVPGFVLLGISIGLSLLVALLPEVLVASED